MFGDVSNLNLKVHGDVLLSFFLVILLRSFKWTLKTTAMGSFWSMFCLWNLAEDKKNAVKPSFDLILSNKHNLILRKPINIVCPLKSLFCPFIVSPLLQNKNVLFVKIEVNV